MDQKYCPYCMTPVKPGEPCPGCGLTEGSYHPQSHHLPPGTVLAGRYLLGRVLGEGGFGITYIGCDTRLELRVAVKEYFPGNHVARNCAASLAVTCYEGVAGRGFEKGRERFIREARTMAKMDKTPQIVAVRDFFQENNTAYIVMEYVDGTTFKELVAQKGGRLSTGELLPMVEPLFGALDTMHQQGLIHRDISPDNLMLENGMVRLLDFGCARESEKGNETMTIVLKQGYSPVEQYQHKGQGPWTDVYSLAATMYYCLTGTTPPQALDRICDDELIPPRKLGADLTREQERALLFGMGLQPTRRFRSVREFYAAMYQGAPVPLSPRETVDAPERESAPETGAETLPENRTQMPPETGAETPPENRTQTPPGNRTQTPPETGADIPLSREPAGEPAETPPEPAAPGEADGPAGETAGKPGRKKLFIIGGAVAAAVLIIALVIAIPKLMGGDGPAADGSQPPEVSMEPLPEELFGGAAEAAGTQEFLELLADDSVSAIIIPEGQAIEYSDSPITISKPVRLEPGAHLWAGKPLTVSSVLDLVEGAWLDQDTNFTLTESGALYIGPGCYIHVGNSGMGSDSIAGTMRIAEGGDFGSGGETVSLSGTVLANGHCNFDGNVAVSGAVQVAESGSAFFGGFTTVSGAGRLEINGNGNASHVVRTVNGGSVTVGGTGYLNLNVLWLEKNTDLNAAGDRIGLDQARFIVADEDGPFENAAHVGSFRELEQAVNDRLVSAVVIDSGFEAEYGLTVNKPVLIREGVELSAPDDQRQPLFTGVIVNHGSMTGFMTLNGQCVYLNYGVTDVSVYANGGENYLLNMGELNLRYGQYINGTIVNLGRMRHETYGGEDTNFLDLVGSMMDNLGELTVCSGNRMWFGSGYFENVGEFILEEGAQLENPGAISTGGGLIRVRGEFNNNDGILALNDPSNLSMEGGRVEGGIIQTGGTGLTLENNESIVCDVQTLRTEPTYGVEVSSADELMAELDKGGLAAIRVTGDVTVDGSLSLGRALIIDGGARLKAAGLTTDQTVYVYGGLEVNELTFRGGQLQLWGAVNTGVLTLEDSDGSNWGDMTAASVRLNNAKLINWGSLFRCGELTLDGGEHYGSRFYNRGYLEAAEGVRITVGESTFVDQNWLEMLSGSITVDSGGTMTLCGGAHLYDGVTVTNRGGFHVAYSEFYLDGGASIENYGHLAFNHWNWQFVGFGGEVTNRGYMSLSGAERVDGVLDNYGSLELFHNGSIVQINGQLNNNGTAFTYNREAGFQGRWTGRALEYR